MNFKKDNYLVCKKIISKEISKFLYEYFVLKRQVAYTLYTNEYLPPNINVFGKWTDDFVPNTYCHYGDVAMETLLKKLLPEIEKKINFKLIMNYSYARLYMKGDVLPKHIDRYCCEVSTTLNLGGDLWPFYLKLDDNNIKKINLYPGDMLIYRGDILEHWREPLKGKECCQVFLHYNKKNKITKLNEFDNRLHLGLPPISDVVLKKNYE